MYGINLDNGQVELKANIELGHPFENDVELVNFIKSIVQPDQLQENFVMLNSKISPLKDPPNPLNDFTYIRHLGNQTEADKSQQEIKIMLNNLSDPVYDKVMLGLTNMSVTDVNTKDSLYNLLDYRNKLELTASNFKLKDLKLNVDHWLATIVSFNEPYNPINLYHLYSK